MGDDKTPHLCFSMSYSKKRYRHKKCKRLVTVIRWSEFGMEVVCPECGSISLDDCEVEILEKGEKTWKTKKANR